MSRNQLLRPMLMCLAGLTLIAAPRLEAGNKYKVLHAFTGKPDGGGVYAGVTLDPKGNLYGTTWAGGTYGNGTVYELVPSPDGKWTETILYSFCPQPHCTDGASPMDGVVVDRAGNLYGAAIAVTFELSPDPFSSTWVYRVLCDCGVPSAIDKSGNLYGIGGPGKHGAGDVMQMVPPSTAEGNWTTKTLYSFCSQSQCRDGDFPEWGLSWDASGNLYGTTEFGGNYPPKCSGSAGCGVAYQLESVGNGKWKYHLLHVFAASSGDGQLPYNAGVTIDSKGNVYGTTLQGGISGTVFKLSPLQNGGWKETILYNFPNAEKDGSAPAGGVTLDNMGNLYGTASAGGDPVCSCGVVFKMMPQTNGKWSYSVLHRFKGTDGLGPGYNLIFDKNYKHLYGTTVLGGLGGAGVVYEIKP